MDRTRRTLAVLDGLHGQIDLAADAVAAGPDAAHRGLEFRVDDDAAVPGLDHGAAVAVRARREQGLADRLEHGVGREHQVVAAAGEAAGLVELRVFEFDRADRAVAENAARLRPFDHGDALGLRELLLGPGRAHARAAAAIDHGHRLGAEFLALYRRIDRRVAAADHDDAAADRQLCEIVALAQIGDEIDRVAHAGQRFPFDAERVDAGKTETQED